MLQARVRRCLQLRATREALFRSRLWAEPDGTLGGEAELENLVEGVRTVRERTGVHP
jgi:hypothetical protein